MNLIVYAGIKSQTGIATLKRFRGVTFPESSLSFEKVLDEVSSGRNIAVLPFWNSHKGELDNTQVLQKVFDGKIKFEDIWPSKICFKCLGKSKSSLKSGGRTISVSVVKVQCGDFLRKYKLERSFLYPFPDSTVAAYREFCKSAIDLVIIPDETSFTTGVLVAANVANKLNFTVFSVVSKDGIGKISKKPDLKKLINNLSPKAYELFGVEMSVPGMQLTDSQNKLLYDILGEAKSINEMPKIFFIFKRSKDRCGILLGTKKNTCNISASSSYEDQDGLVDIQVKEQLGSTKTIYSDEVFNFIGQHYSYLFKSGKAFVKHIGEETCFYACPALGILTHGYDAELVEKMTKKIVIIIFNRFLSDKLVCTSVQKRFFDKFSKKFIRDGESFINFQRI